ncbi:TadE family protein [Nocardioides speluncae]|uniref:TadE family protein n=1 Tax=Nocardioides speluncae TaxID=2670337 RepID=UPI001F0B8575|nr:TadE/TadG family type IV pilus assembly protein [Nocardioides speluncae]
MAGPARRRDERGSAVVDFVLVMLILIPLFLGILQLALVLHVRNTLASAASEGARYAATQDRGLGDGEAKARTEISTAISGRYASSVDASSTTVEGAPGVVVAVEAEVPPLGLWGPAVRIRVEGHAIEEVTEP